MPELKLKIKELMFLNRRNHAGLQYTVPSSDLYPFQWLWDSCFHAIILSHYDPEAAKEELLSVLSSPLPSGMLPHIIYHQKPTPGLDGDWGREKRGSFIDKAWRVEGSSSITQPCIVALAVHRVLEVAPDPEFLAEVFPILEDHFEYLHRERVVDSHYPLLAIINPDESGEDNSPRFDLALNLPPQHSANTHLDARLDLINQYASCSFKFEDCMENHFSVIDVPFNILYAEDLKHLANLAYKLGEEDKAEIFNKRADEVLKSLRTYLWNDGKFKSYDAITGRFIEVSTWAIFMPLYAGLLTKEEARKLIFTELLNENNFKAPFGIRTTSQTELSFDAEDGFWRGPIWFAPHWFIYQGLKRYDFDELAEDLQKNSINLLNQSGFREQYHPTSGQGQGARNFTWGGLVIDMV